MKRLVLFVLGLYATVASAQSSRQDWYAPTQVGTVLRYAVYNQEGEITGYSNVKVDSITIDSHGRYIVLQSSVQYDAQNRQVGDTLYATTIISNDTTYVGINRIMNMSRAVVQTWGTLIALPATIGSDTRFENRTLGCNVRFAGMKFRTTTEAYDYTLMNDETLTVDNRIYESLKFSLHLHQSCRPHRTNICHHVVCQRSRDNAGGGKQRANGRIQHHKTHLHSLSGQLVYHT